jgi:opacity protein-like surface antigen
MNKMVPKILFVISTLGPTSSFAYLNVNTCLTPYLGVQLGSPFHRYSSTTGPVKNKSGNDVERIYGGVDFNRYFGLELGYTSYPNFKSSYRQESSITRDFSFDLLAKLTAPINNKLSFYVKGGPSYIQSHGDQYVTTSFHSTVPDATYIDVNEVSCNGHRLRGMAGVGVSYNLTNNLSADISYMKPIDKYDIRGFSSLGLTYRFKK